MTCSVICACQQQDVVESVCHNRANTDTDEETSDEEEEEDGDDYDNTAD